MMRQLSDIELDRLKYLSSWGIEVSLIEPTQNGLSKSILDATQSVRFLLKKSNMHDFSMQPQGPENKVKVIAHLLNIKKDIESQVTLYRPHTKNGDPRIWFSGLSSFSSAGDILSIAVFNNKLWVINLTTTDVRQSALISSPINLFLNNYSSSQNNVASELLELMKNISKKGFISGTVDADTNIGRLLEKELKIPINSSRAPDYKGIEIKSFRSERTNRKNLFAQVPDWNLSKFKSSKEILDAFGYDRENIKKLYCTVTALRYNSQGLKLRIENTPDLLVEESNDIGDFLAWRLEKLRERLVEKHSETFWVSAISKIENGCEYFHFTNIEHTKGPLLTNFEVLIETGGITVDHLIKEKGASVVEKGPIFKIAKNALAVLFPPSKTYDLTSL
jgi:hypothetical protein